MELVSFHPSSAWSFVAFVHPYHNQQFKKPRNLNSNPYNNRHHNLKFRTTMRNRRLPQRLNWILSSPGLLHGVRWFETDVSGLHISPIYKGELPLKMGPKGSPETSVSNHLTLRNNPEDGIISTIIFVLSFILHSGDVSVKPWRRKQYVCSMWHCCHLSRM